MHDHLILGIAAAALAAALLIGYPIWSIARTAADLLHRTAEADS